MKSYTDWEIPEQSDNPILLIQVMKTHVISQTEDMYPYVSVYEQERTLYIFHQNDLTNCQCYKKFNTCSDAAKSIGVTRKHKVLLEHVAQEKHSDVFENIT